MFERRLAIRCEGISKCFLRNDADPYHGLRASFNSLLMPRRRERPPAEDLVWALRDVAFEVPAGGVFGVLGRNGSGKSVLLRILAGVTKPTAGRSEVRGTIGSVLHLGAMLVPELTGREAIYQTGTILRLPKSTVDRHFDEIVDFSGIGSQLDSLVRGYSTGMQVRLAFSVMVLLHRDVLLIDEALSVADQEFRAQCVERIRLVAASGCTVVLVSHDLEMMADLCDRALFLERGALGACGESRDVIAAYRGTTPARAAGRIASQ
jgi:ABC-type polysaccharide/polyol phosphate transport system ATPase subunit